MPAGKNFKEFWFCVSWKIHHFITKKEKKNAQVVLGPWTPSVYFPTSIYKKHNVYAHVEIEPLEWSWNHMHCWTSLLYGIWFSRCVFIDGDHTIVSPAVGKNVLSVGAQTSEPHMGKGALRDLLRLCGWQSASCTCLCVQYIIFCPTMTLILFFSWTSFKARKTKLLPSSLPAVCGVTNFRSYEQNNGLHHYQ